MHILVIPSERYVPEEEPLAGIFQYDQAYALKRVGLQVGVIAPKPRSLRLLKNRLISWPKGVEFNDDKGIPTYRYQGWGWIPGRTPYVSSQFYRRLGKRLFKKYVVEQGMPDIIHAHNALHAGAIGSVIKKSYRLPFVLTEHSSAYLSNRVRRWQIRMIKDALRNADARLVVSPYLGQALERHFGDIARPWRWVPNILDKRFEEQSGSQSRSSDSLFRFLTVSSLVPIKNHRGLLEAFSDAFGGASDVQLRIGGNGPLRRQLEHLAGSLGIARQAIFLGALSREEVLNEMRACDVFVLPSQHETFGVVLIEALACGKPVVATNSGGPASIVHEKNGILVPVGDNAALANAMKKTIQNINCYNAGIIREDCIARFGEKAVVGQLVEVYHRVLDADPHTGGKNEC